MSRYRNWHQVSILALAGFLFTTHRALAQRPTDIGGVPPASQFPADAWRGAGETAPAKPKVLSGPKNVCPWCGTPHRQDSLETPNVNVLDTQPADAIEPKALANYLKELLTRNGDEDRPATKHRLKTQEKLRPGEPAQVILELKERLGDGALDGTEFADSPDMLVKLIRALEAEQGQDEEVDESERKSSEAPLPISSGMEVEQRFRIDALRGASGKLDEAANYLEEQDLFERADEIRSLADKLRRDARAAVGAIAPRGKRSDPGPKPAELRHMVPLQSEI